MSTGVPSRPNTLLRMMDGKDTIITIISRKNRQMQTKTLNSVWRSAHAADKMAPQGPPAAVPAAICAAAFPPSTLAWTTAAEALATALVPAAAACFALSFPTCLAAFAICFAASP